ncbi:ace1 transcription factor [Moniliophthora roreri MCA 2997]|uniref:Ace1 transcription factor n=1 Tax=Moniliophthora roreri (strain MCA 2997) TaxID=1381753 RepID=V2YFQ9_MONRO|nr:ace1 transcription factor [Moniliophthora roreri MCA 2997]
MLIHATTLLALRHSSFNSTNLSQNNILNNMVLISSKKYACETCIKGHRSSSCKHTDRPLFEIKKKGRPVTQCEHCRELRKTKQVHVKCVCAKAEGTSSKDSNKTLESAAFPNGLPEALEASVALQLLSEGTSSDSDHGSGCTCYQGGECHCWVPRKSAPRRRKKEPSDGPRSGAITPPDSLPTHLTPTSHATLTRIAELRPVLPKPSARRFGYEGPVHEPSSGGHQAHGAGRHHIHDSSFFSPYGRAYDYTHQSYVSETPAVGSGAAINHLNSSALSTTPPPSPDERTSEDNAGRIDGQFSLSSGDMTTWNAIQSAGDFLRSLCSCTNGCSCQGCMTSTTTSNPAGTCTTNGACSGCINCAALAATLPFSDVLPPNTALSIPNDVSRDASWPRDTTIDEWAKQVSFFEPGSAETSALPSPFDIAGHAHDSRQLGLSSSSASVNASSDPPTENGHRSDRCMCPQELCECNAGSGCSCDRCQANLTSPINLTFAISGERGSCCGSGLGERRRSPFEDLSIPHFVANNPSVMYDQFSGYISMPDGFPVMDERMSLDIGMGIGRSRSSSSSSSSASRSSHFSVPQRLADCLQQLRCPR